MYRIEMESVPRAHGVLTFSPSVPYNFLHINTARLGISAVGGGTRITRMLAPSQSYTENRSIRFLNECPCHVHVRHVNSPYTKEHRPSTKECFRRMYYLGSDPRSRRREDITMRGFLANSHDRRAVAERIASAGATVPS